MVSFTVSENSLNKLLFVKNLVPKAFLMCVEGALTFTDIRLDILMRLFQMVAVLEFSESSFSLEQ